MGCVCGKASSIEDKFGDDNKTVLIKGSSESQSRRTRSASRRDKSYRENEKKGKSDARLMDKKGNGSRRVRDDNSELILISKNSDGIISCSPRGFGSVSNATEGELVAAGWPSWLASVAGEAILGWLPRKADTFEKLDKIGQGTYSSVYKARDLTHNKLVALKRVRFDNADLESVKFMAREILILRRLDHPNIIKLDGLITSRTSCSLYLVFEYMEHDLTGLASLPNVKFSESQVKCYMKQLLSGLSYCHNHGIIHRDIKGSNLLVNDQGILKIADFGLATFFDHEKILTSRVVTLWYRPPELLLGATHYGVGVDLWSTGCILGELYAGTPIMPGRTEVEQLHKIFKLCGSPSEDYWRKEKLPHTTVFKPIQPYRRRIADAFKDLPPVVVDLMDTLLSIDPEHRGTAGLALKSDFFRTHPFACDPSSLPKYPPSKEIDAKLRESEHRRQGVIRAKDQLQETRGVPALDANAEITRSLQRKGSCSSRSQVLKADNKEGVSRVAIGPSRRPSQAMKEAIKNPSAQVISHSGPLAPAVEGSRFGNRYDNISIGSTQSDLSQLSRPVLSGISRANTQDQRCHVGSGRSNMQEAAQGHGSKGSKIHFSGPLMGPSSAKIDELLKEHDRRIQEAVRRSRIEKSRLDKARAQDMQRRANSIYSSSLGAM
ncbi:unnamed protein product [Cuscuta campestris]|uniref:Protein kinase domain-containing protein n=1 Tax=Cuscuta campestris TaxID=132261 RepID=A0A484M637_9ASTE|nr:unnamed protein product [Cuscuta campestris]